ncbi:MAG: nitroreductase family protein [Proteobacteria bacterium]|nr:nitroreductase family protein [Pseudomonadota bacterium]
MNFLELAGKRRSVRFFEDREVDKELILNVLEAGNLAPSAHNKQSWKFYVISGEKKNKLAELIGELSDNFPRKSRTLLRMAGKSIYSAPVVIAVFSTGELVREAEDFGEDMKREIERFFMDMEIQSASAAVQNMLLQATELGLGAVWLGIVNLVAEKIQNFLQTNHKLLAMIPIGYPVRINQSPKKKSLKDVLIEIS